MTTDAQVARTVQYCVIPLDFLLLCLLGRRLENHLVLQLLFIILQVKLGYFSTTLDALGRLDQVPLIVRVAHHGVVNTVHRQLALLLVHGPELVPRVLRHVHERLVVLQ